MPLVKFLKGKGLVFKYALVGKNKVEYFRLQDFKHVLDEHKAEIKGN